MLEEDERVMFSDLAMLTFHDQCIQADTTIPFRIIAVSTDYINHARVLESPVHDLFQRDNTLGMKLMHEDGKRFGSNVWDPILEYHIQVTPLEPHGIRDVPPNRRVSQMMRCCVLMSRRNSNDWRRRSITTWTWCILIRYIGGQKRGSGRFMLCTRCGHNNWLGRFLLWLFCS
jgi:hypothetical protein